MVHIKEGSIELKILFNEILLKVYIHIKQIGYDVNLVFITKINKKIHLFIIVELLNLIIV